MRSVASLLCLLARSYAELNSSGQLLLKEDGKTHQYSLDPPEGGGYSVVDNGHGIRIDRSNRVLVGAGGSIIPWNGERAHDDDFKKFTLPGYVISASVHLPSEECGCFASMYLVSDPGPVTGGNGSWTGGFQADSPCPQMGLFTLNSYSSYHESHACTEPWSEATCDLNGTVGFSVGGSAYGPGPQFKINTRKPFRVSVAFHQNKVVQTVFYQEKRKVSRKNATYANGLWDDLARGQILALSYWINGPKASGRSHPPHPHPHRPHGCSMNSQSHNLTMCSEAVVVSNIVIKALWSPSHGSSTVSLAWTFAIATIETAVFLSIAGLVYHCLRRSKRTHGEV